MAQDQNELELKTLVMQGIVNTRNVYESKDPAKIKEYMLQRVVDPKLREQITTTGDKDVLGMAEVVAAAPKPSMDLVTAPKAEWKIAGDSASVKETIKDGSVTRTNTFRATRTNGVWY